MPESSPPAPYHTLIHLGCGASPNLDEYRALAEHIWLIDADNQALDTLEGTAKALENVHIHHALADTEKRPGTFYRYSLPWANGLAPVDDATQRLYPGLRCLGSTQQLTTPVDALLEHCLPEHDSNAANLLLLDVGHSNAALLQTLEESGMLNRLANVIVVPAHRRAQPVAVPPSLYSAATAPGINLTLPENSQALQHHPLLQQGQHQKQQLAEYETLLKENAQQLKEAANALRESEAQREQHQQALAHSQQQLTERDKQLAELTKQRDEAKQTASQQAEQHAQALKAEQDKSAQLAKERDELTKQRDEAKQAASQQAEQHAQALKAEQDKSAQLAKERDQLTQQRDEAKQTASQQAEQHAQALKTEQDKTAQLAKERDGLTKQRDEAKQAATQQAEQHTQALKAEQEKIAQLKQQQESLSSSLEETRKEAQQAHRTNEELRQQLKENTTAAENAKAQLEQEQQYRQSLIDKEMLKAEAQLELIKDILIKDKVF